MSNPCVTGRLGLEVTYFRINLGQAISLAAQAQAVGAWPRQTGLPLNCPAAEPLMRCQWPGLLTSGAGPCFLCDLS